MADREDEELLGAGMGWAVQGGGVGYIHSTQVGFSSRLSCP